MGLMDSLLSAIDAGVKSWQEASKKTGYPPGILAKTAGRAAKAAAKAGNLEQVRRLGNMVDRNGKRTLGNSPDMNR